METMYSFAGEDEIISPQLVYYKPIIEENIRRMIALAGGTARLWPHLKTHKMAEMVKLQVSMGITRFKCATIAECEMAAGAGATDLILAYPLVGPNIARFLAVSAAFPAVTFYAIDDDTTQVELLSRAAAAQGRMANLLIDLDMGQHRTGVPVEKAAAAYAAWAKLPGIRMCGMHCYDGHRHETDYTVRNGEVCSIDTKVEALKREILAGGLDCSILVMGGTPSFPCHAAATGEYLSPGTCVVQDAGYQAAYPDLAFVPGAAVLTRVVSRPSETTFTLDMGTKAVASDPSGERGVLVGMEYAKTVLQNEEHWVVKVPAEHVRDIPAIGTVMFAIPTHVCPTSALYPSVPVIEGGKVIAWWEVTARNRKITY